MPFPSVISWVGLAPETTRGTAVTPSTWFPATAIELTPNQSQLEDKGMRGSMVTTYQTVQGFRHDQEKWTGPVYLDSFPHLVKACLGSPDTKTGAGPYLHTFSLLNNTPSTGNQPPSYTVTDFAGDVMREMPAGQLDQLSLKFDATGILEYDVTFLANPYTEVAATSPTFTTLFPQAAYNCAVTQHGGASTRVVNGQIDIKRNVKPITTMNSAHVPYRLWAAACEVTGKFNAVFEDNGDLQDFVNNVQPELKFVWTDTNSPTNSLTFDIAKCSYLTAKPVRGKDYIESEITWVAIPTAGAATAGGVTPCSVAISNQQSTVY